MVDVCLVCRKELAALEHKRKVFLCLSFGRGDGEQSIDGYQATLEGEVSTSLKYALLSQHLPPSDSHP